MIPRLRGIRKSIELASYFKKLKIDLVHSFHYGSDYSEALASRIAGIPWIFTKKNMSWGGKSNKAWKVRSSFASHIIVQNSDMINQFYRKYNNVTLIPRGINLNEFISESDVPSNRIIDEFDLLSKNPVIVTVANIVPLKGVEFLIKCISNIILKYPNIKVLIVGDNQNKYFESIKSSVYELGLKKTIIFTGKRNDVHNILSCADLFILPTLKIGEGSPVSLLEAMAKKRIVLASNVSGSSQILSEFPECLFEPENLIDLIQKINFLLNLDKNESIRLRNQLSNTVKKKYNIKIEVNKTMDIYKTVFKGKFTL